jgi:hypothetical protein
MSLELGALMAKAEAYKTVLDNTVVNREQWHASLKPMIKATLEEIIHQTQIKAVVNTQSKIENLESMVLDLGRSSSGISEYIEGSGVKRTMIKTNGSLIYQQLFNGKIMVMIIAPFIEGYGEPKAPKTLQILRPHELTQKSILGHAELLFKEIIAWEDFDDDEPSKMSNGFQPIGFNRGDVEQTP